MPLENTSLYEFGKFRFDPANHLLLSDGNPISLTPKAFEILLVLVENGNRLTTKEELMRRIWPDSFVEESNLTVNMSALRKGLGETPDGQPYIETVPKKGYRFVASIACVCEHAQGRSSNENSTARSASQNQLNESASFTRRATDKVPSGDLRAVKARSARLLVLVSILVCGVVLGSVYFAMRYRTSRAHGPLVVHRLAVLPFQNLRNTGESDFLGFSLADTVISKLGYVSELTVRPSYAVQKYKTQPIDMRKVAAELNVDTLLVGTFLHEGDDLRIACQLVDVKSQDILWKGTFDLKYDRLLTVQDTVAKQIINEMELNLSPSEAERFKPDDAAVNAVGYESYLRGIDL